MKLISVLKAIGNFMSVPRDNPELLHEQYRAFSKQMPLLYAILLANTWSLAYNFIGVAPDWLSLYVPAAFSLACFLRLTAWLRAIGRKPDDDTAYSALKRTNRLSGIGAVLFSAWSIALFPYGSPYEQAHVAFYMAITVIGVIFCLMHLRPAAVTVTLIFNAAFISFFGLSDIPSLRSAAVNVLLVSSAMLVIMMVYYRDFTRMVAARAENFRLANIDVLTGLPNRRHFFDRLRKGFNRARAAGDHMMVGVLDLDGFKPVNDLYGHSAGDELLVLVGRRLEEVCAGQAYAARLGGDEFAFIVNNDSHDAAQALGHSICCALRAPCELKEAVVEVTATVGFAFYPARNVENEQELFERADYALYQGKRKGPGGVVFFSEEHAEEIRNATGIEKALRGADLDQELSVLFQPIVDMQTGETVGFEALARWNNPGIGPVSPAVFIPVAERAGIVHRLTKVLLAKALATAVQWPPHIRLSFNLSARDISNKACSLWLTGLIAESGFTPSRIDFEITETSVMHDYEQALSTIEALKALGCGISLDDFGTGYSSLSQLHSLPLTKIKIDRSFVIDLDRNPASYKIVHSMISLSRDMGLECIVEGVETAEEAAALRELGCSYVQGYRYSKPLSRDAALDFLSGDTAPSHERPGTAA